MSYIRSGSNPESLYIWGDTENATISEGNKPTWDIPLNIFNGLIRKFHRRYHEYPCSFKGAMVEEVWVSNNGEEIDDIKINSQNIGSSVPKIKLSYNNSFVIMYDVTWEYIVYSKVN